MNNIIQLILNGISLGSVYALIALGFTLVFSVLKFSNFSHGGIMVVSAYFGYILARQYGTSLVETILLTALMGGILAVLVEIVGFERLRQKDASPILYFVASVTLGQLLQNLMTISFSSNFYSYPAFFEKTYFEFGSFTYPYTDLLMLVISAVAIGILLFILYKTRLGISIRALSMDISTAKLMGVNVSLIVGLTFFISGTLGAIAGVFLGMKYLLYPQLGSLVLKGFMASVLGGLGNITGALYGGLLLGLLEVFLISLIGSGIAPVFTFLFTMIFLLVRPQGISGKFVTEKV